MEGSKAGQARRRLDEQTWRAVLERFDGAAMTVQEFCLREGLTRSVFMRWRARLRCSSTPLPGPAVAKAAAAVPKPSFVDLGLLGGATSTTTAAAAQHAALELRIELGAGISLHLARR
jgi:hypothetical protein